jgi:hypothetical protein
MDTDKTAHAPLVQWGSQALLDVAAERRRQIEIEGWTPEHDDEHDEGDLAAAAACYSLNKTQIGAYILWPWNSTWWKPRDTRSNLVRAAALLLAEIERLDRDVDSDPHEDPQAIFGDPRC